MLKSISRLLPLLLACHFFPASVGAQQPAPRMNLGDAVVTGFSGTIAPDPGKPRPANKSAADLTFINPDGPSARIVGVGRPGHVWDGRLFQAPKTFDVFAKDTGQVFGVALDDAPAANIYLAASSAFGLNLVARGADGLPERRKVGGPGIGWMKGQFGLDLQGDPGSIYKVDGTTGAVTLFARVMLDGVPNPGPALGNLAYDAAHKQLFASDLYTGMIHRFAAADGSETGAPYNHGVTGRSAANLPPMPFNPANRPNIANDRFNAENPDSWGYAPPERRVWGLAVQNGRLFYSARNGASEGAQIWSVGIASDGRFGTDARLEIDGSSQPGPYPVSDIAFAQSGAMILAQRAPITASYDYSAFTKAGEPRVLRYWLKDASDPPSPGLWKPMPEEYAVGFAGTFRNTDGGIALGYGYGQDGTLDGASCEASLWTTAQNLRNNPALRSQLEPGGPLVVNGLQGSPADMVRGANEPPATSYFVDYDDKFGDTRASGHLGGVRILARPCASADYARPRYASNPGTTVTPPPSTCVGPNCFCVPTCVCPPGTVLKGRECVKDDVCKEPMVPGPTPGSCVCPHGTVLKDGQCVKVINFTPIPTPTGTPLLCPPPLVPGPIAGTCACSPGAPCVCPPGMTLQNGICAPPPQECRPPLIPGPTPGSCVCPPGTVQQGRTCVPQICPSPLVPGPCECPPGMVNQDGLCVPGRLGSLEVLKKVVNESPVALPPGLTFQFTVSCGGATFPLSDGGSQTINNIPVGTSCTVSEVTPPPPNICPHGSTPSWSTTFVPTPPTVIITIGTTTVTAINTFACIKPREGRLTVTKVVNPDPRTIGNTLTFPMTVTCTSPSNIYSLNVNGNTSLVPFNVPVGSQCGVAEGALPPLPPGCTWLAPIYTPASIMIAPGLNVTTVTNGYQCRETCVAPLVLNAAGECACPQDTQLVDGKCVPIAMPPKCRPPQISNPAGICICPPPMLSGPKPGLCNCPRGTVLKDGQCVKVETCSPRQILNSAGICVIPEPKKKPKAEKRPRQQREDEQEPRRQPRIEIDRIPGLGGGGRGGGGGFGGGGDAPGGSPGRR